MGDVKLTAREASRLLEHLDHGVRQVVEAREEIIQAMARRTTKAENEQPPPVGPPHRRRKR